MSLVIAWLEAELKTAPVTAIEAGRRAILNSLDIVRTTKATVAQKMHEQFGLAVGLLEDAGAALDLLQDLFPSTAPILLHDLFRGLEMNAPTATADNPFSLRFSLHNTNNLFALKELEVVCIGEGGNVRRLRTPAVIDPGATVHGACELTPGAGLHKAAEIQVHLKYRMMFWPRSTIEYFTWTRAARQWLRSVSPPSR
jgi:hypothetical protein